MLDFTVVFPDAWFYSCSPWCSIFQLFSLMLHKNASDKFSFESCKFTIQRSKESTGRWSNIAITMVNQEKTRKGWNFQWNNDYFSGLSSGAWASWTPSLLRFFKFGKYNIMFLKASYGGSNLGSRAFTHFNSGDYEVKNISYFFFFFLIKKHSWCWFSYCSRVLADTFVRHCSTTGSPVITL